MLLSLRPFSDLSPFLASFEPQLGVCLAGFEQDDKLGNMGSFKYYLDKPRKNSGLCALYLRYKCVQGSTTFYPPGKTTLAARWDGKAQRLKGTSLEAQRANQELVSFRQGIEQHCANLRMESSSGSNGADPLPVMLKARVSGQQALIVEANPASTTISLTGLVATTTDLVQTLPQLVEQVLNLRHSELRKGSRDQYRNAVRAMLRFCPAADMRWRLDRLTPLHLEAWRQWLILPKSLGGLGTDNQTANNRLSLLQATLTYARSHHRSYRRLLDEELLVVCQRKFKVLSRMREHLNEAEFLQFYSAPLPEAARASEHLVRDVYCLSWLTSLRQSDIFALGHEHLVWDNTGKIPVALDITSIKSSNATQVPLNSIASALITRWLITERTNQELARFSWPTNKIFPQVSRGRHGIIKRVFERVGMFQELVEVVRIKGPDQVRTVVPRWQLLTLHTARHGFGNLMAQKNVPIEDAMLLMGHACLESTKLYYHRPKEQALNRARTALDTISLSAQPALPHESPTS